MKPNPVRNKPARHFRDAIRRVHADELTNGAPRYDFRAVFMTR
jgi:hypothetical protein